MEGKDQTPIKHYEDRSINKSEPVAPRGLYNINHEWTPINKSDSVAPQETWEMTNAFDNQDSFPVLEMHFDQYKYMKEDLDKELANKLINADNPDLHNKEVINLAEQISCDRGAVIDTTIHLYEHSQILSQLGHTSSAKLSHDWASYFAKLALEIEDVFAVQKDDGQKLHIVVNRDFSPRSKAAIEKIAGIKSSNKDTPESSKADKQKALFNLLNKEQIPDVKKVKECKTFLTRYPNEKVPGSEKLQTTLRSKIAKKFTHTQMHNTVKAFKQHLELALKNAKPLGVGGASENSDNDEEHNQSYQAPQNMKNPQDDGGPKELVLEKLIMPSPSQLEQLQPLGTNYLAWQINNLDLDS